MGSRRTIRCALPLAMCAGLVFTPCLNAQTVFGPPDCGQWVNAQPVQRPVYRSWLLGYLSGLNVRNDMANLRPRDPLDKLSSAEQAYVWMDNYCRSNPLSKVTVGGWTLFQELSR